MNKLYFLLCLILPLTVHGCVRTLLANDGRLARLSLPEGLSSVTWKNWLTEESDVDLVWGDSSRSYLTIAPKGTRMGATVDLGTESKLMTQYHIDSTDLLPGSIFLSIHMNKEEEFKLLKDYEEETFQLFDKKTLAGLQIPTKSAVINPVLNHIYLINITDSSDAKFSRIIKLKILSNSDRNTLVIRYNILWDSEYGKDSTCFATADEPDDDNDDGHSHNHYTFKRAPRWVKASIISLFAMIGLIIIVIISLIYAVHRKRVEEYERI